MSYIVTGVKRLVKLVPGLVTNKNLKSRSASVDEIDSYGNGALAVSTYAAVQKVIVDDQGAGTVYVGEAAVGSLTADPVWRVRRLVTAAGITPVEYATVAAGNPDASDRPGRFDHIWDNRAALTYV
jgi:hypothetical protein